MASPIAHISVGYAIYRLIRNRFPYRTLHGLVLLGICVGFSLLPDIDCFPAFFTGDLKPFHNYYTHSIFFILAACLVSAVVFNRMTRVRFVDLFLLMLVCATLHVVIDLLSYGRGQMTFWPVLGERVKLPVMLFYGLRWSEGWVSVHHIWTVLTEALFGASVIWLAAIRNRGMSHAEPQRTQRT